MSVRRITTVLLVGVTLALAVSQTGGAGSSRATEASAAAPKFQLYVKVKGQKQGQFHGDGLTAVGRTKDWMLAHAYDFSVLAPYDQASGLPSGKRQYKPVVIAKEWGPSMPQFLSAMANNENLTDVTLEFVDTVKGGATRVHFRVQLQNAHLSEIKQHYNGDIVTDDLSFVFRKITVNDLVGGTIFSDDWSGAAA